MGKRSKNLSLDPEAIQRGERYAERHDTNVSRLVSNFLSNLPAGSGELETRLSPAVRRLLGVGSGKADLATYRRHLIKKYGR